MAIAKYRLVALDCPDASALAAFYAEITGGIIRDGGTSDDWVQLDTGTGTDIAFQEVSDYVPPDWPNGTPQQAHLDFEVEDLDAGEAAVLSIGAKKTALQPSPEAWRVFLDPAGHPFCLVTE